MLGPVSISSGMSRKRSPPLCVACSLIVEERLAAGVIGPLPWLLLLLLPPPVAAVTEDIAVGVARGLEPLLSRAPPVMRAFLDGDWRGGGGRRRRGRGKEGSGTDSSSIQGLKVLGEMIVMTMVMVMVRVLLSSSVLSTPPSHLEHGTGGAGLGPGLPWRSSNQREARIGEASSSYYYLHQ